ncbi:MAG: 3-dehydroquinate synthase [Gemmataceae bacterium]|nr:3-dehydroquinate synthase [Gemmataceae bacterium]
MSRLAFLLTVAFVSLAAAQESEKTTVELSGTIDGRGLPMAECDSGVLRIKLSVTLDRKGSGTGTLILDAAPNPVDEFGFPIINKAEPPLKVECTVRFIQKNKVLAEGPRGAPAFETEWQLYEITGPKIVSKISLARQVGGEWSYVRFIWATKEGKKRTVISLQGPRKEMLPPPPPCHPGCFPAGPHVQIADGSKAIEDIRPGDMVSTVNSDGKLGRGKVAAMFVTKNQLVQVNIEGKTLITTETQPLSLADGKLRAAGDLKAGDRIQSWVKGERVIVSVKSVEANGREAQVYNLVLGDPVLFIANGFLARSKPPAPAAIPIP